MLHVNRSLHVLNRQNLQPSSSRLSLRLSEVHVKLQVDTHQQSVSSIDGDTHTHTQSSNVDNTDLRSVTAAHLYDVCHGVCVGSGLVHGGVER